MKPGKSEITNYLTNSKLALENAGQLPEIFVLIEARGYTRERLETGNALHQECYRRVREQELRYAGQHEAGQGFRQLRKSADRRYGAMRRLARVALRGEAGLLKALGLDEKPRKALNSWLGHARQFVHNALEDPNIWQKLETVGISRENLRELRELTGQVEKAAETHEAAKGAAIKATKQRDEAFREFRRWMYDFRQVCRVALASSPQFLEKLGIKA